MGYSQMHGLEYDKFFFSNSPTWNAAPHLQPNGNLWLDRSASGLQDCFS
jgi:hypothetical protein